MQLPQLIGRRLWFLLAFALLLLSSASFVLTETTLGAELAGTLYLPLVGNLVKLCGTIPC